MIVNSGSSADDLTDALLSDPQAAEHLQQLALAAADAATALASLVPHVIEGDDRYRRLLTSLTVPHAVGRAAEYAAATKLQRTSADAE